MIVYAVVDESLSLDFPLAVELEVFVRREDARAVHRGGARRRAELANDVRIEVRERETAGSN